MELLGHEGENSILSYLKSQGWATGLETRRKALCGSVTKLDVTVELTKEGVANHTKVVEAIFRFVQNLKSKGPQEWFAKELNALGEINFDFPDRVNPMKLCSQYANLAANIDEENMTQLIRGAHVSQWNASLIKQIGAMLCDASRVMIFLRSRDLEDECTKQEHFMLTKYIVKDIAGDLLRAVEKPDKKIPVGLPPKNSLITKNTDLRELDGNYCNGPVNVEGNVWFCQDPLFRQPKGVVQLKMFSADLGYGTSVDAIVFAYLWQRVLKNYMHEYLYTASKAGYQFYCDFDTDDFSLYWKGFNENLSNYVQTVCKNIVQMRKANNLEPLFQEAHEWLMRDFVGTLQQKPYRQALDMLP